MKDETIIFPELQEREKARVSFRESKDGEITAVFLDRIGTGGNLACYAHTGQHSECSVDWVRSTKAARSYAELRAEMESIGYDIIVSKKMVYPKPGCVRCEKCGARIKVDKAQYERICREEDAHVVVGWKRMSLEEWAVRNHECKTKKEKVEMKFRARIASNRFSSAFDTSYSSVSTASAMANLKRKNPAWADCYVWAEILEDNGDWMKL